MSLTLIRRSNSIGTAFHDRRPEAAVVFSGYCPVCANALYSERRTHGDACWWGHSSGRRLSRDDLIVVALAVALGVAAVTLGLALVTGVGIWWAIFGASAGLFAAGAVQ